MLRFGILGPLAAWGEDREIELGATKQRALLAVLLLHAGETMSKEQLVDALWGKQPPQRPAKEIQDYVSQLRKRLGDGVLVTRAPGYALELEPGALDLERFEGLFAEGRRLLEEVERERRAMPCGRRSRSGGESRWRTSVTRRLRRERSPG